MANSPYETGFPTLSRWVWEVNLFIDTKIPEAALLFSTLGKATLIETGDILANNLTTADILITRSVTRVDSRLLKDTPIKIVASPTSGIDHFDLKFFNEHGIEYLHAPGSNARAVAEYIVCLIAYLEKELLIKPLAQPNKRAAIVGVGHVGTQVAEVLNILGYELLLCDPLRAEKETDFKHTPLDQIADVDLISIHTPLSHQGLYPTYHFLSEKLIQQQKPNTVIINTARGQVMAPQLTATYHSDYAFCNDVHASEPSLTEEMWNFLKVGTPHIAGHSVQAKLRGAEWIAQQLAELLACKSPPPLLYPEIMLDLKDFKPKSWRDFCLKIYNPFKASQKLLNALKQTPLHQFSVDKGREIHPIRHEFAFINFKNSTHIREYLPQEDQALLEKLHLKF